MRAVVQRVKEASVKVNGETVGRIGTGLLVLLGVENGDGNEDLEFLKRKLVGLRVFNDTNRKMNLSIRDVKGEILMISQFTLFGDCRKGNRPSFSRASAPAEAERLYQFLVRDLREEGIPVETGVFQALMDVSLVNDGPVTLVIDSRKKLY